MTTVLVVDDEVTLANMLRDMLEDEGYRVLTAYDGQQALERLAEATPDAVLTDVMMPRLGGWDLYRALRAHPEYRRLPVILMSAGAELHGADATAAGAEPPALMRKPFELDELLDLLNRLIDHLPLPSA